MTKKLYWDDAYIKEFDATVVDIDGTDLILDKTVFYPRSGGLVGDTGEINGVKVVDTVFDENKNINHVMSEEKFSSFGIGQQVHGKLDWERRYRIMRMHTTAHLLSSIFNSELGVLITGNQVAPDESRMDFNLENFDKDKIFQLVEKANQIIQKDHPVKTYFLSREEAMKIPNIVKLAAATPPDVAELRIVEIEGVDIQADGGPHVKNLKEIGKITALKTENKGKNNRRLYFTVS